MYSLFTQNPPPAGSEEALGICQQLLFSSGHWLAPSQPDIPSSDSIQTKSVKKSTAPTPTPNIFGPLLPFSDRPPVTKFSQSLRPLS